MSLDRDVTQPARASRGATLYTSGARAALVTLVLTAMGACGDATRPAGPEPARSTTSAKGTKGLPLRNRILFSTDATGDLELYTMSEDDTSIVRLTYSPGLDDMGAFSPDGRKIAFVSDRSGTKQLYVMNADGSGLKQVTAVAAPAQVSSRPAWAPDGKTIYFAISGSQKDDIYRIGVTGVGLTPFLVGPHDDTEPAISPDGSRIAFTSDRDGTRSVWIMNLDGSNPAEMWDCGEPPAACGNPAWSPDGTRIAFTVGGHLTAVYDVAANAWVSGGDAQIGSLPAWSPDGLKIVFTHDQDHHTPGYLQVATMNADVAGVKVLTNFHYTTTVRTWSWSR